MVRNQPIAFAFICSIMLILLACESTTSDGEGSGDPVNIDDKVSTDGDKSDNSDVKNDDGGTAFNIEGDKPDDKPTKRETTAGEDDPKNPDGTSMESGEGHKVSQDDASDEKPDADTTDGSATGESDVSDPAEVKDPKKDGPVDPEVTYLQALAELERVAVETGKPEAMLTFIYALILDKTESQNESLMLAESLLEEMADKEGVDAFQVEMLRAGLLDRMNEAKECAEMLEKATRLQYEKVGLEIGEVFYSDGGDPKGNGFLRRRTESGDADRRFSPGDFVALGYEYRFLKVMEYDPARELWKYNIEANLEMLYKDGERAGERVDKTIKTDLKLRGGYFWSSKSPEEMQEAQIKQFRVPDQIAYGEYIMRITLRDPNRSGHSVQKEIPILIMSREDR